MDVNRSEPIVPTSGRDPRRDPRERHHDDHDEDNNARDEAHASWSDEDAVDLESALSRAMSPEVQSALEVLASRLEPMREDLERARVREQELRHQLEQHPYLPVLNRSGLEHEVARLVARLARTGATAGASGSVGPLFVCISIRNAPDIRLRHGRSAYDQVMRGACDVLKRVFSDNDMIGCLGGDDLGVVVIDAMSVEGGSVMDRVIDRVRAAFSASRVDAGAVQTTLHVDVGACSLLDYTSFSAALAAADAALVRNANGIPLAG